MNRLYERSAIIIICLAGYSVSEISIETILLFLLSIGISLIIQLIPYEQQGARSPADMDGSVNNAGSTSFISSGIIQAVIIGIACCVCGWVPALFSSFPIFVYEALWIDRWYSIIPIILVLRQISDLNPSVIIIAIAGTLVATCIYFSVYRGDRAIKNYHRLRDELAEKKEQLSAQNERLLDAQNTEVHLATLKERNRIAREIHDNVGHMLTRSLLQVGAIKSINKSEELREPLEGLNTTLDQAMTSVRESVHDLYDDSIDLKAVLEEYLSVMGEGWSTQLIYQINDPDEQPNTDDTSQAKRITKDDIPGSVKICFAGVTKEAITNAIKHSNGNSLTVELIGYPGFFKLEIRDNGHAGEIRESGIGLKNMQERVSAVHGKISFKSGDDGFKVQATVPR